jgi:hypothetical protein
MVCDNIIILDNKDNYNEIINGSAKNIRIWDIDKGEIKMSVQFSSSAIPNMNELILTSNYIWSYYFEKDSFVCLGYVKVSDGQVQKSISWNNANFGKMTEKDSAYAQKFLTRIYPHKAKEIFV